MRRKYTGTRGYPYAGGANHLSCSLSKSEKNYEHCNRTRCLAIVFACQKFHQYIFGKKIRIETDHKPLEIIVRKPILSAGATASAKDAAATTTVFTGSRVQTRRAASVGGHFV